MSGLAPFQARLVGGAHASIMSTRRLDHDRLDEEALGHCWSRDDFAVLGSIRDEPWNPGDEPQATISRLARQMRGQRELLVAVIFSPDKVLGRLLEWSRQLASSAADEVPVDSWTGMCWAAEAAWSAVTGDPAATPAYTAGDAALWRPVAARMRFLVLSEPMRWRTEPQDGWWRPEIRAASPKLRSPI